MISASRSGPRFSPARCFLISSIHSGMLHSRDSAHGTGKLLPLPALQPEDTLSFRRQPVIPPSSLIRFLDPPPLDRKSTRLNSSHVSISYAVFCLKKKKKKKKNIYMNTDTCDSGPTQSRTQVHS